MNNDFPIPSRLSQRIATEVAEGVARLSSVGKAVALFGSARVAPDTPVYQAARATAYLLAERGIAVITGGGPGVMEAANRGAQEGTSIGLNIVLPNEQKGNPFQNISLDFNHFASRKVIFCRQSSAFVVFAGGVGTLDELSEVLTLIQTGKMPKVPVILYDTAFWAGLVEWMRDQMLSQRLIGPLDMDLLSYADSPAEVLEKLGLD
ncbi:TIGR00730 family Rossman fold protein [Paraburkholderia sp. UCT31]|uniref:LOG family protein n=1 Tax=Paraburkholderia sp. UCT31 TaxID=2615209 RepID=UPI00165645C6|nr:TIGR00730 family Rossman fold protein [Paraburkholderia sp. UCT31]MBC8737344.1 TIGR00730 family Rossman fold protein [Paraburkholderia sp. UCT31]